MFKILVHDLITTRQNFVDVQPKLHGHLPEKEAERLTQIAKSNYIRNKQAWAELEHYNAKKAVLGKHPMFERLKLKEAINLLPTTKLIKKINALNVNITRNKQKGNYKLLERDEDLLMHAKTVAEKR